MKDELMIAWEHSQRMIEMGLRNAVLQMYANTLENKRRSEQQKFEADIQRRLYKSIREHHDDIASV